MKRISTLILGALLALSLAGCRQEAFQPVHTPAINVTGKKLSPDADAAGKVPAFVGTEVTAEGFNLDHVSRVTIDDVEATIVSRTIKQLVFEIPALDLAQSDEPHPVSLKVYGGDPEKIVFNYEYFVTIPVVDALVSGFEPKNGTVGTVVTISGRNLEQVTSVTFGKASVKSSDFVSASASEIKLAVPAQDVTTADTETSIEAIWSGGTIDVTASGKFLFKRPVFSSFSQSGAAKLGDEITLAGENLDLVSSLKWGDYDILISEQTATSIVAKVPSGIEKADPVVVTRDLMAFYGTPDQGIAAVAGFKVDTTPIGPAAPVFTSAAPADEGFKHIYLNREVVVKGENMASVEKFEIDGVEVALKGEANDIEARFVVPATISGTAAKDVTLVAIWNGGNRADFGTVKVCPFYYHKGLRIGIGSNSKSTYTAFAKENAFILLNDGKVISSDKWYDDKVDEFAYSGNNTITAAGGKVTEGKETEYYSVQPYLFAGSNSSNKLSLYNPANTANQLKQHYRTDANTALPTAVGTPIIWTAVVDDAELKATVEAGNLQDIKATVPKASSGALDAKNWFNHGLITIQYIDYATAVTGSKPGDDLAGVRQCGLVYVRDITCVNTDGSANATREGYIEFDIYWSNVL